MSKKILVLGSLSTDAGEDAALETMRAFMAEALQAAENDINVYFCHVDQLGFVVHNQSSDIFDLRNNANLHEYDLVFFRGKLRASINDVSLVSYYLQKTGVPSLNTAYANRRATGKVPQMFQMHDMGMPIPFSVSASNEYLPELIEMHLTYPIVVKDIPAAKAITTSWSKMLMSCKLSCRNTLTSDSWRRNLFQMIVTTGCLL